MTARTPDDGSEQSSGTETDPGREPRLRVEFRSDDLAEPFRDRFDEPVAITVYAVVQLDDGTHLQYWELTHTDPETVIETVVQFPTTLDARLLSTVGDTHRIEVLGGSRSLFAVFDEFDGTTRSAVYDEDGVRVVAEFPLDVETDAVVEAVHDVYPDLDVVESQTVGTVNLFRRHVEDRLTDRQLTALRLAYFGGYYEQPRVSTGAELAERMDISKQAFHEHLRKAYVTVFSILLEGSTLDDGLTGQPRS